ncbi:MAG: CHASE2 domain-containing protein [Ramlibacter sp.]
MKKFKQLLQILAGVLSVQQFPRLYALAMRGVDAKNLGTSWTARLSRVWGRKVLLAVGTVATAWALVLFAGNSLTPDAPSPAHDAILKMRHASPVPSRDVVIVDIDERSLALLAPEHGRWPWPYNVLGDGAQKLADLGARAVLLNVITADPDKRNPEADAALDVTVQLNRAMAFPMVRLNPENDARSQLKVSSLPGAQPAPGHADATVAALLPMFGSMHDRMGVANQRPDTDGVVRKYPLVWKEDRFTLPTVVGRTLEAGGVSVQGLPEQMSLNWRNKKGRYTRIPFADLLSAAPDDPRLQAVKGAFVVIGASAPGIGPTKPTSVKSVEDDSEILATAIDDALHGTWLRVMPAWLGLALNLAAIWMLVLIAMGRLPTRTLTKVFVAAQSGFFGVTYLSASYTNYLIDLSATMSFAVTVFGVIKLVQGLDDSWSRARPGFRRVDAKRAHEGALTVISFVSGDVANEDMRQLQRDIEGVVGVSRVVRVDDLFGGESLLKEACSAVRCLLVFAEPSQQEQVDHLLEGKPFHGKLVLDSHDLQSSWNPEDPALAAELAPLVLQSSANLLRSSRT